MTSTESPTNPGSEGGKRPRAKAARTNQGARAAKASKAAKAPPTAKADEIIEALKAASRDKEIDFERLVAALEEAIATAARTGHPGDGVVSIEVVEEAVRIRTGERGIAAISARLNTADVGDALLERNATADRPGMSDSAKMLLTNVALSTVVLVLVFHAPVAYAGLGAGSAGLLLWARERRARRTR